MRTFFKYQATVVLSALSLFMPFLPAKALVVQPAIQDVQVDPGKGETKFIRATNDDITTQTYFVTIQKFVPKGDSGQQDFLPASDTTGLPEWTYVDQPEITLKPGESANLQVSFRVPPSAPPGGYYEALFLSKRQTATEPLAMLPRLGVLFFVRVNGQAEERLAVTQFSVDANSYWSLPVGFRTTVANEGMIHEQPEGMVTVRNFFGATVAKFPANPDGNRILPQSSHILLSAWSKGAVFPVTGYWSGLKQELNNFAIGPYVAFVTFNGPGFSGDVVKEVRFAVWPWRTMTAVGVLIIALVVLFFLLKKLIIKRATASPKT